MEIGDVMESTLERPPVEISDAKPRRPWLAAAMSLFAAPLGHIYAGQFRRGLVLWFLSAYFIPMLLYSWVSLSINQTLFIVSALCLLFLFALFDFLQQCLLARAQTAAHIDLGSDFYNPLIDRNVTAGNTGWWMASE